jgi:two-component system sensor histidine kinase PilS (NtrC family)
MLDEAAARIVSDWTQQTFSRNRTHIALAADPACVVFDPEHLRRLMINLLDNALRYASQSSHAIEIVTHMPTEGQARLLVWSDGPPLEQTVQTHLFEPFFTSESRSSGLGLYICRELCERYGALIGYQRTTRHGVEGNEFFVVFKLSAPSSHAVRPALQDLFA